jgi:Glycosyltransferase family 87
MADLPADALAQRVEAVSATRPRHLRLIGPRIGEQARGQTGFDRLITGFLLVVAVLPALLMTRGYLDAMSSPGDPVEPFSDAITYLAAGERLNAGHDLYRLVPGDRPVLILPQTFNAPLVSPPPIAVLWRPLAAVPFGFALWIAAAWVALLGAIVTLVLRCGLPAVVMSVVLFDGIAQQLSVANVAAFFPALLILAWDRRSRPPSAIGLGAMAAIKIAPGTMFGWLVGRRSWRSFAWALATALAIVGVAVLGAGVSAWRDYLDVAAQTRPSPGSLSGLTGLSWLSFAILVAGTLAAAAVRRDAWSFAIALGASVLGTPALYHAGFVPLLALLAPMAEGLSRPVPTDAAPASA